MSTAFKLMTKDGDGDDFDTRVGSMSILVVDNGYLLETTYDEDESSQEVCLNLKDLLNLIEKRMKV